VIDLNSGTDYRKQLGRSGGGLSTVFLSPISAENRAEFTKRFDALTDHEPILENRLLPIWGTRHIPVPLSTSSVAWFDFNQLCALPLSAADYLQIVSKFNVLFINNVPKLSSSQRDFVCLLFPILRV
jgi:protein AFG1